jgi:hypothetical protein
MSAEREITSGQSPSTDSTGAPLKQCTTFGLIGYRFRGWDANRLDRAIGALLCILAAASWLPRANGPIDLRWDGGAYYLLGTSMTQGQGYRLLNEPGNTISPLHPPLLPMFVAVHQFVLRSTDPVVVGRALRASACLLFSLQALAIYVLLRAYIARTAAVLAVVFWIFHPTNTFYSDALYAEPFSALATLGFFILQKRMAGRKYFLLAAACALVGFLARTTGLLLFVAWAGEKFLKRDFRQAALITAIALLAAGLWMGHIHRVESSPEYTRPAYEYQRADYTYFNISYAKQIFRLLDPKVPEEGYLTPYTFIRRVYWNARRMPAEFGHALFSGGSTGIAVTAAFVVFAGMLLQITRKQYTICLFVVLNLAAMCITPFTTGVARYMLPLSPLVWLLFLEALPLAWNVRPQLHPFRLLREAVPVLASALLLALMAGAELKDEYILYRFHHDKVEYLHGRQRITYRLFWYPIGPMEIDQGLDWLQVHAGPDDIISASDPQWTYIRTGLKSVIPPFESNPREAARLLDTVPVRYLFVDDYDSYRRYTSALVTGASDLWKIVWRSPNDRVRIYERSGVAR